MTTIPPGADRLIREWCTANRPDVDINEIEHWMPTVGPGRRVFHVCVWGEDDKSLRLRYVELAGEAWVEEECEVTPTWKP